MPQLTCSDEHIYARTLHGKYVYKITKKIIVQAVKEKNRKNNKEPHVRLPGQRTVWARNTFKWPREQQ